jgi:hypothetical protein
MGMKSCDRCGMNLDKKELNGFDSTSYGHKNDGEKLNICRNCLFDKFAEYLSRYDARALAVYPFKDKHVNAYMFYPFQEMTKKAGGRYSSWPQSYVDQINHILPPPNTVCQSCRTNNATFAWCSPEIFPKRDYTTDNLNPNGSYHLEHLCCNCLLVQFKNKVVEIDLRFEFFTPPVNNAEGLLTPWDV